jgi:hypothetical protein
MQLTEEIKHVEVVSKSKYFGWAVSHKDTITQMPFVISLCIVLGLIVFYNKNGEGNMFYGYTWLLVLFEVVAGIHVFLTSTQALVYFLVDAPITLIPFELEDDDEDDGEVSLKIEGEQPFDAELPEFPKPKVDLPIEVRTLHVLPYNFMPWYICFLVVVSVLGCAYSFMWHGLMLIEFFRSPAGMMVMKAISVGSEKLMKSAFMGLIMVLIWAMFSWEYFQSEIENYQSGVCTTLWECTWKAIQLGFRGDLDGFHGDDHGNIRGGGYPPSKALWDDTKYTAQVIFVLLFSLLWNFILAGIIQGQIIVAFAEIRAEADAKEADEKENCMVCSLSRFEIESSDVEFDSHIQTDHCPHNYLYYMMLLDVSPPADDTGLMAYIRKRVEAGSHSFIPIGTCAAQNVEDGAQNVSNDDLSTKLDGMSESLHQTMATRMDKLEAKMDELLAKL